jgi:hypothetical protein
MRVSCPPLVRPAPVNQGLFDTPLSCCDGGVMQSGSAAVLAERDSRGLTFVAEMYGMQTDQLAVLLGIGHRQATALVARWTRRQLADSAILGPGAPWVWLTRAGLRACGSRYAAAPPALGRLAHIRATTAVRLALEAVPAYANAAAHWRSERRIRTRLGGRLGGRDHLPDAEIHWPDGGPAAWAGECWAIEVELTAKTITRTTAIMREVLARTGDYGCPAAEARSSGARPRHARAVYVCSPAAAPTVYRARSALGSLALRVEIRDLPPDAYLPLATKARNRQPPRRRNPAGAAQAGTGAALAESRRGPSGP